MRLGVGVGRYRAGRAGPSRRVVSSAADLHRALGPGIVVRKRYLEWHVFVVVPVTHPIVNFKLNPGGRQQIE